MLEVAPEVVQALAERRAVVALESAVVTHGLPRPLNLDVAEAMKEAVRDAGAVPAMTAVWGGAARVGLDGELLRRLARDERARKCAPRDLAVAVAGGGAGGTTVGSTLALANAAGIRVFATGGIGGVHRGDPFDVSADLAALGRTPMVVVCSGVKSLLDGPRTLERLETEGVALLRWRSDALAGFVVRDSGLRGGERVDDADAVVAVARARDALALSHAVIVAVPVPAEDALDAGELEGAIATATEEAVSGGVQGSDVTPFVLARIAELTGGRSVAANAALLVQNARVAAEIAVALDSGRPRLRLV